MSLSPTSDPHAFRDSVRQFFETDYPQDILAKVRSGQRLGKADHIASQCALNARGWLGVSWPADDGGPGWTPRERYVFDCELDRAGAPTIIPMGVTYIGPILCAFGTPDQKTRWLPDILKSRAFWAQGYSEPESGSDLASLGLKAERDGDHYILTGTKIWTSGAHWADWIFCLARTTREARKQHGISMVCVDLRSPGVSIHPIPMIDGSTDLNRVEFTDVRVPVENRIGDEGRGWHYANVLLKNERLSYAHIGAKRRDLAAIRKRAAETPWQHGLSMAADPAFQRRLSACEISLDVIEQAIQLWLDRDIPMSVAALLKIACTECAQRVTELATELAGPMIAPLLDRSGPGWSHAAPFVPQAALFAIQSYLFERAQTIYGGSTEIQKNIIWRSLGG